MNSKRIKSFKSRMIKELPKTPNSKATIAELEAQSIASILFYFVNWVNRMIPCRRRTIRVVKESLLDVRWQKKRSHIDSFLSDVERGKDLSSYLSTKVNLRGYVPSALIGEGVYDKWEDKDFVLSTTGFHHFHLDKYEPSKPRSDEMIFARVTRNNFYVLGVFNHSVFSSANTDTLEFERKRLLRLYDQFSRIEVDGEQLVETNLMTMSGHPLTIHQYVQAYIIILDQVDHKLDDREFFNNLYTKNNLPVPKKNKLKWVLVGLDLGVVDNNDNFFNFYQGHL
ncbi:hypothetical protein AB6C66_23055 [Vibrio splendidus]|uniref:hypothetical protein n=1 Tax=Vibrio splendidus TaxID=29497 RepID=UPI001F51C70F|nr:hypothetical protein [Vibrio splendidus]